VKEGVGEEPQSYDGEKVWSSINHSLLSVLWGVSSSHPHHYPVSQLVYVKLWLLYDALLPSYFFKQTP
jgi:hypothetical protein